MILVSGQGGLVLVHVSSHVWLLHASQSLHLA